MNVSLDCPRCRKQLNASTEQNGSLSCESCGGMFVPGSENRSAILKELANRTPQESSDAESAAESIHCPACSVSMQEIRMGEAAIDFCSDCGGTWLDAGEIFSGDTLNPETAAASVSRYLLFGLSLPERLLRSSVGMAAGAAKETAALLVPQAFQSSKTYELVIKNSLKFLTEDIGGVEGDSEESPTGENYVARKAVGSFVDLAGLATLHLSPVWMMAIVSDVAYGTKSYVIELADELKKQGLIDEDSTINHVDDVLNAIQNASGQTASMFDTPPLSVAQLKESLESTRAAISSADYRRVIPEAELTSYWNEMKEIANEEEVSLIGVSGALTMHTLGKVSTVSKGTLTGLQVAGGLFNRHVVGHYADALKTAREKGFYQMLNESSAPYVEAVWNNFSAEKETWTEQIVSGKAIGKAFRAVSGLFGNSSESQKKD
ncbi:MAG: zf-TFIIB domain-containing protein [Planctomycetes bacterium]|nr:zf-TFIIB domain-containing protein [Planctomycetota bacterium]